MRPVFFLRFAKLLFRICLPKGATRVSALSELTEDAELRFGNHWPLRARLWFLRQVVNVCWHYSMLRLDPRSPSRRHPTIRNHHKQEGSTAMGNLVREFRYAVRTLVRQPGFTVVAILTMALGIGANTAMVQYCGCSYAKAAPISKRRPPRECVPCPQRTWRACPHDTGVVVVPKVRIARAVGIELRNHGGILEWSRKSRWGRATPSGGIRTRIENLLPNVRC